MSSTAFAVFVLPFLIGIIVRLIFLKWKRAYMISGVFTLISVVAWIWTTHLVDHGVDGTVMLWALMASELTAGLLLVGGVLFLVRRGKSQKT